MQFNSTAKRMTVQLERFYNTLLPGGLKKKRPIFRSYLGAVFAEVDFEGATVLDIGGGDGTFSYFAAASGARHVTNLEPIFDGSSESMHARFHELGSELGQSVQVSLDHRTIENFDNQERFDIILLHNSINHLDESACEKLSDDDPIYRKKYLTLLTRVSDLCAEDGRIIVCDCSNKNFFATLRMRNPFAPSIEWHKHQPPELWASLLEKVGFTDAKIVWTPYNRLRPLGRLLNSRLLRPIATSAFGAFFITSHFRLSMKNRANGA